jgi:hypothetical protein
MSKWPMKCLSTIGVRLGSISITGKLSVSFHNHPNLRMEIHEGFIIIDHTIRGVRLGIL